jgi:cytochrome c biogenesis protein CcdA/glutaredoxin
MKKVTTIFSVFVVLFSVVVLFTASFFPPQKLFAESDLSVDFFWGDGCPHCAQVEPVIDSLKSKYSDVKFNSYEVYHNKDNALLLYSLYDKYEVPDKDQGGVPVVFIKGQYFMGDKPIIDNLENKIITELSIIKNNESIEKLESVNTDFSKKDEMTVSSADLILPEPIKDQQKNEIGKNYSLWAIAGAAVVDSINPCAIAVLLILLTALMLGAGNKKRALYGGLAFTFSIYITYFLFGLGLLQLIAVTNIANIIAKIVGVVALLIGLANIKDFFFYGGGGFVMEIPRNWRPALKKILNSVTSPVGAFFSGFLVTLFELPCTGGPYFFVIGLLSQSQNIRSVIPTLLFYNLVFVLPLLLIAFGVYFGVSSIERAEKWKEKNIKLLHLLAGIIMLALGVWVFFT